MKNKNIPHTIKKKHPLLTLAKIILSLLTAVFPMFIVIMTGAGLIYNRASYGEELFHTGIFFIISGILMTVGVIFVWLKQNIASIICSCSGFGLCMLMLYKLADHADKSGWSDKYTMLPISDMYISRIMPTIIPFLLAVLISIVQFFSYEAAEKRREKKRVREEKENAPAPPII